MMTKRKSRKATVLSLAAVMGLTLVLGACAGGDSGGNDAPRTLRIGMLYGSKSDESYFRQQYTDIFEMNSTNLTIELVPAIDYNEMQFDVPGEQREQPDPLEKMKEIMTGANPVDVVMLDIGVMSQLIQDNMLVQLDPLIQEDKLDTSGIVPAVLDMIKSQADGGQLYGLSPTFSSQALFYNKKLFVDKGVTPPRDNMSWDEVFNLARQMKSGSGDDTIYGLGFQRWGADEYSSIQTYINTLQLRQFDQAGEKMTMNTPEWENAWKAIRELYKDGIVPDQEGMWRRPMVESDVYNPFGGQPFLDGRMAMTVGEFGMINELISVNERAGKVEGAQKLDWDVVTLPYHPSKPEINGSFYIGQITAINTNAQNRDDAWEFVKFLNSKEWAKLKSRNTYELVSQLEYIKPREGMDFNIGAFYNVKPMEVSSSLQDQQLYKERPNLRLVSELTRLMYDQVKQDKKSVKDALAELDARGNDLLQKIKANPDGEITGVFDDLMPDMGDIPLEKRRLMEAAGEISFSSGSSSATVEVVE